MTRFSVACAAIGVLLATSGPILADGRQWFAGPYSVSDELGGFLIRGISGSGTRDDPLVIDEEMLSASPVTLVVRISIKDGPTRSLGSPDILHLRFRALNNSGLAWTEYEFELQATLGQPSIFGDGLSFDQRKIEPDARSSDLFKINNTHFEPFDRLLFTEGHVDPLETASFSFCITDFTSHWLFYIRQDPRIPLS